MNSLKLAVISSSLTEALLASDALKEEQRNSALSPVFADASSNSRSINTTTSIDIDSEDSDSEDFTSYETESTAKVSLDNAEGVIDRLYRLSFKIRNPAVRHGFTKAQKYQEVDDDTGVDLMESFKAFDSHHLEELFARYHHAPYQEVQEHYLVKRLAKANTRRRQQFGQWRRHRIKLDVKPTQQLKTLKQLEHQRSQEAQLIEGTHGPYLREPSRPSTATWLNQDKLDLYDNTSVISTSTYAILSEESGHALAIPQLPQKIREKKEFECPYCHVLCSRRTSNTRAWR